MTREIVVLPEPFVPTGKTREISDEAQRRDLIRR